MLHEEFNWLRPLYERPYWRRVWIVQELVLAKVVVVCCGDKFIDFDDIYGLSLDWGSFEQGTVGLTKPDALQKILPLDLITVLKKIATSYEETANRLTRRFLDRPDIYFRFYVTHGAGLVSLEEWERMGEVKSPTEAYLRDPLVSKSIDSIMKILCIRGRVINGASETTLHLLSLNISYFSVLLQLMPRVHSFIHQLPIIFEGRNYCREIRRSFQSGRTISIFQPIHSRGNVTYAATLGIYSTVLNAAFTEMQLRDASQ
jgi:hypothetical protein